MPKPNISRVTEVSSYEYPGSRYYVYVNGSADRYFRTRAEAEQYRDELINQAKRNGETK